jgi:hypothetical protein
MRDTNTPTKAHETHNFSEVRSHHQGSLLLIEVPTKGRVFLNPVPHCRPHRSRRSLTQMPTKSQWYKSFLGSSTILETPKARLQAHKEQHVPRTMNSQVRMTAPTQEREIREIESKSRFRSRTYLTPKRLLTNWREKNLGREIGVESLWIEGEQPTKCLGSWALGFREREGKAYIVAPTKMINLFC